ncbi:hypothetical protein ACP4OV_019066 [Aristida adscensionis]
MFTALGGRHDAVRRLRCKAAKGGSGQRSAFRWRATECRLLPLLLLALPPSPPLPDLLAISM